MTHPLRHLSTLALLLAALSLGGCASGTAPNAATPAAGSAPDEPVLLRWSWSEGDTARYRSVTESDATITAPLFEEATTTHSRQVAEVTQTVVDVSADRVATLRMSYDRVELTAREPSGEEVRWSSDEPLPEDEAMREVAGLLGSLAGKTFTVRVDERGDVLSVEGLDDLFASMGESLEDEEARAMFDGVMAGMLSEDTLMELVGQGFVELPIHPVEVGDSWTRESTYTLPVVGSLTQTRTYRVEQLGAGETLLSLDGSFGNVPDAAGAAALPLPPQIAEMMDFRMEIRRGDFDGSVWFDRTRGLASRLETTAELEMTLTMTPKGELAESMPEPLVMDLSTVARTVQELVE